MTNLLLQNIQSTLLNFKVTHVFTAMVDEKDVHRPCLVNHSNSLLLIKQSSVARNKSALFGSFSKFTARNVLFSSSLLLPQQKHEHEIQPIVLRQH